MARRIIYAGKPYCRNCPNTVRGPGKSLCHDCHSKYQVEWRRRNPLEGAAKKRSQARAYLHMNVKRGKVKKQPCEVCGKTKVEAHHPDYSKPLEVRWLCQRHHLALIGAVPRTWEGASGL